MEGFAREGRALQRARLCQFRSSVVQVECGELGMDGFQFSFE